MYDIDIDPPSDYKRLRIEAGIEVELWIQKDYPVLNIFRRRIRFARDPWNEFVAERQRVIKIQNRLWRADWKRASLDPERRNMHASPPGPNYEWKHHDPSYQLRPTPNVFADLCSDGFKGTWEEVDQAWQQKRWGYWKRKSPIVKRTGLPWLSDLLVQKENTGTPAQIRREPVNLYYACLTAIHDGMEGVTWISWDIWPDFLQRTAYRKFLGCNGDKSELIRTALAVVRQDLDAALHKRDVSR